MPATDTFEIEITLDGTVEAFRPATYWEPAEGGGVYDVEITGLGLVSADRIDGRTVWNTHTLLDGVNVQSPDVQRLFLNILALRETAALEALAEAA